METKTLSSKTRIMVESAILIAIGTVLSLIKIVSLPYAGSVTVGALVPVIIISYRHGAGWGVAAGFVYGIVQQLIDIHVLGWVTSWYSIVAVILLDYAVAFAVIGFGGVFRRVIKDQALALASGAFFACVLRFVCHVVSGATVWAGLSIPTEAALIYSLAYNSTYMIPETLVTVFASYYLGSVLDFEKQVPERIVRQNRRVPVLRICAWGLITAALIADVALIFSKLQDAESGEWLSGGLSLVNWKAVIAVTCFAAAAAAVMFVADRIRKARTEGKE